VLILSSLSGIQDFLFDVRESGGGQARSLRNRSFRIQLIAECVALRLLEAARLPYERLLFSAAGKACINADGLTADGLRAVREAAADMERRLVRETHGRLRVSVVVEERPGSCAERFERASRALIVRKLRPCTSTVRDGEAWRDGMLVVREPWDADAEAEHDAGLGRRLITARWLTIRRSNGTPHASGMDTLGFRATLDANEPAADDGLVSCSNLAEPETAPRSIERRFFHPRRLARHVPRDDRGDAIEFVDLAAGSRGAPMLGVLKADADSLGAAVSATLQRTTDNGAAALRTLSDALDRFFAETLEGEKARPGSPWKRIYTVFSGGDDLLAVGPWNVMLDFAGHVRTLFNGQFGPDATNRPSPAPLTISAGVAVIKPKYPVHLAAQQAEDLLELAKGETAPRADQPKDQCAALGSVWKWRDHDAIIHAGKQLADWVDRGIIQRGWLHTLLELALLRRGQAGPEYAGVPPAVATSRLAYHVARNWPRKRDQPRDAGQRAQNDARAWINAVLGEFDQVDSTTHVATIHLPAIVRYAMLATRGAGEGER
jgi:CRISPR-associated protein Csm1